MPASPTKITQLQVEEALNTLERLEFVTGKLKKEALLWKHSGNPVLRQMLFMALGNTNYYVHVAQDFSSGMEEISPLRGWKKFLALTEKLSSRKLTGNRAKGKVLELFLAVNPIQAKWLSRVLDHNLRIGVSDKTLELIYGGGSLAASHENGASKFKFRKCMLALPRHKLPKKDSQIPYPVGAEYKLDGERFLAFVFPRLQQVEIVSRENRRKYHIEGVKPFTKQLFVVAQALGGGDPIFLDGEFLSKLWNKTSSIVGSTKNFNPKEFLKDVRAVLWDWAPISEYESGIFTMPWIRRKSQLLSICPDAPGAKVLPKMYRVSTNVYVLGHRTIRNEEQLARFYSFAVDRGFEGLITKQLKGPAIFDGHRSALAVKHKPEEQETGVIVSVHGGKGKHAQASPASLRKAKKLLLSLGKVVDDGYYLRLKIKDKSSLTKICQELKEVTRDSVDQRVSVEKNTVCYRYSERLGYFIVKKDGTTFRVGTGIPHKNGADLRMELWQRRKELVGMKVDFTFQKDTVEVAKKRFNRFARLREDLS